LVNYFSGQALSTANFFEGANQRAVESCMIEKFQEKIPVHWPAAPLTFTPSFSHDNQPYSSLRQLNRQKRDPVIESFDSGGNQYV
jgi:hypothetical protein